MMNRMRRNVQRTAALLVCGVGLTALPALAQSPGSTTTNQDQTQGPPPPPPPPNGGPGGRRGGGGPEQRLAMMQSQLNLTPDQSEKVKAILQDGRTQMMALRNDSSSQEDRRSKMAGLMKTENEKIKAVLTPDQKTKFEEMEKKQREQMRERRREGGDGPPPPAPPS